MNPDRIFKIANGIALIPWFLMVFLPFWSLTNTIINLYLFPIFLSFFYIFYLLTSLGKAKGNFSSLAGLGSLFKNKDALLAGWIHYLVFDLFVGSWEWNDSIQNGFSHFILVPCLLLTLMFGPFGFLIYYSVRIFLLGLPVSF